MTTGRINQVATSNGPTPRERASFTEFGHQAKGQEPAQLCPLRHNSRQFYLPLLSAASTWPPIRPDWNTLQQWAGSRASTFACCRAERAR